MSWRAAVKLSLRSNSTRPARRVPTATALFLLATPPCGACVSIGPYQDSSTRAMSHWPSGTYNFDTCRAACIAYRYMALQAGTVCFCENDWNLVTQYGPSSCGTTGGQWCNYVYDCIESPPSPPSLPPPAPSLPPPPPPVTCATSTECPTGQTCVTGNGRRLFGAPAQNGICQTAGLNRRQRRLHNEGGTDKHHHQARSAGAGVGARAPRG